MANMRKTAETRKDIPIYGLKYQQAIALSPIHSTIARLPKTSRDLAYAFTSLLKVFQLPKSIVRCFNKYVSGEFAIN
jgi:hypothetical protein